MTYAMQGRNHKEKIGETEDSPKFSDTLKDPILIKGEGVGGRLPAPTIYALSHP